MSKEYNETNVKPAKSMSQEPEKTNGSKVQNVLLGKRKLTINFDDKKYGVKASTLKQEPFKLRDFLKSIPIIGRFLARIFTPEKIEIISNPIYDSTKKSQSGHISKIEDEDNKHAKGVGSKLEKGDVEQVDNKKTPVK